MLGLKSVNGAGVTLACPVPGAAREFGRRYSVICAQLLLSVLCSQQHPLNITAFCFRCSTIQPFPPVEREVYHGVAMAQRNSIAN